MPRRLAVPPGGQHVPAEARLAKHHENASRHDEEGPEANGNGQEPLGSDPVPDVVAPGARGDRDEFALRRKRVDPADRDRRSERGQERSAAGEPGQRPVDDANRRAGHEARAEHGDDRQVQDVEAIERDERRHGEIGPDREVDASGRDNDEQRQDDKAAVGRVGREIAQVVDAEVALGGQEHADDHADERQEGHRALDPSLGEDFREHAARGNDQQRNPRLRQRREVELS